MTTTLEYLCANTTGDTFIVVTNTDSRSFNMYVGPSDAVREVTVFDLQRMRDGGTTYIFTAEGTFFAPSPLRPPAWGPGSDGSCQWPTAISVEDACGWPTPEEFRPKTAIAEQQSFIQLDPAEYLAGLSVPSDIAEAKQLVDAVQRRLASTVHSPSQAKVE
ncbi:hypothetical protein [Mycolicibacterium llatzerense]|uniref:hypothetical protein n=1 Tax=Mycolicibacterium llatzerense TaxID=280871 RepID=UPI0031DE057D